MCEPVLTPILVEFLLFTSLVSLEKVLNYIPNPEVSVCICNIRPRSI